MGIPVLIWNEPEACSFNTTFIIWLLKNDWIRLNIHSERRSCEITCLTNSALIRTSKTFPERDKGARAIIRWVRWLPRVFKDSNNRGMIVDTISLIRDSRWINGGVGREFPGKELCFIESRWWHFKLSEERKDWGFALVRNILLETPVVSKTKLVRGYTVSNSISE